MKKVIAAKHCDPEYLEKLLTKIKKWFIRLRYALCAIPFLLTACAKKVEEKPEATPTPKLIGQVIDKKGNTPSPTPADATDKPIDASLITPVPSATPVPQTVLTEEELIAIAKDYYQRLKAFDENFKYSEEEVLDQVKMANGIYECLNEVDQTDKDEILIIKQNRFNDNVSFLSFFSRAIDEKIETMEKGGKVSFSKVETFKIYDPSFSGIDTFKLVEDNISELCDCFYDWDAFSAKGANFLKLVEEVFINNCGEWNGVKITPFKSCHPDIRLRMTEEVYRVLISIKDVESYHLFDANGNAILDRDAVRSEGESGYTLRSMADAFNEGQRYGNNEITKTIAPDILALMDAYMAMEEQGVYDAYLTGNATRKAIIKHLCVKG